MTTVNSLDLIDMRSSDVDDLPIMRVPDIKRIKNARKERANQLKEWQQYDRRMNKESEKLQKKGFSLNNDRGIYCSNKFVKFSQNVIFLEAAARGDLDEGKFLNLFQLLYNVLYNLIQKIFLI